jgi:hypothetical protein
MTFEAFPGPIVLALHFAAPWVLLALALAGVPILLHWLFRRPQLEERWAAMEILRRAMARRSRRTRLQTLLLLAVRVLLIAVVALAFARPTRESGSLPATTPEAHRRILIVDTSLSMGSTEQGETPLDQARTQMRRILSEGAPGDSYRMLAIGPSAVSPIVIQYSATDPAAIAREIDGLEQSDGLGEPAAALETALAWIEKSAAKNRDDWEVVILSDFQKANWSGGSQRPSQIASLLQSLAKGAHLVLQPCGRANVGNSAIVRVDRKDNLVRTGQPVHFQITVEGFEAQPRSGVALEARVDESVRAVARIDLPARGPAVADLTVTFDAPGPRAIEFTLSPDEVAADDRAFHIVNVRDHLRVLIVGASGRAAGLRPRDYLRLALDPESLKNSATPQTSHRWMQIEAVDDFNLARQRLEQFDVVFLAGVPRVTPGEAERLDRFVREGGGLIVGLSPNIDVENYNTQLFRSGEGLLPAKVAGWTTGDGDVESAKTFEPGPQPHPLLDPFIGNPDSGLTTTQVWSYARVESAREPAVLVLSNGDPVLLEGRFGRGRCLMTTISFDEQGSNWTVWPSFVPLIQEMTAYVATAGDPPIVTAGEPLPFAVNRNDVRVRLPNGDLEPLVRDPSSNKDAEDGVLTETRFAGIYRIASEEVSAATSGASGSLPYWNGETRLAAVNPNTNESRIERLTSDELDGLLAGAPHALGSEDHRAISPAGVESTSQRDLSTPFLWCVLMLAVAEVLLTWRFAWGAAFLAICVTGTAAWLMTRILS